MTTWGQPGSINPSPIWALCSHIHFHFVSECWNDLPEVWRMGRCWYLSIYMATANKTSVSALWEKSDPSRPPDMSLRINMWDTWKLVTSGDFVLRVTFGILKLKTFRQTLFFMSATETTLNKNGCVPIRQTLSANVIERTRNV